MKLNESFFENKKTLQIAEELIGKILTFETEKGTLKGIINETEAYTKDDESCHAYNGKKTKRNEVMFKQAGHLYVYFTYGMYHCCNIVTQEKDIGEAVLIRSIIPIKGIKIMKENRNKTDEKNLTNGPAKLCQAYGFDKRHNSINLLDDDSKLYLEDTGLKAIDLKQTTRIGISKAKENLWRFVTHTFE